MTHHIAQLHRALRPRAQLSVDKVPKPHKKDSKQSRLWIIVVMTSTNRRRAFATICSRLCRRCAFRSLQPGNSRVRGAQYFDSNTKAGSSSAPSVVVADLMSQSRPKCSVELRFAERCREPLVAGAVANEKASISFIALIVLTISGAQTARCPQGGTCPAGTWPQDGGRIACSLSKCSAANCGLVSRARFCSIWHANCLKTGGNAEVCAQRKTACQSTG